MKVLLPLAGLALCVEAQSRVGASEIEEVGAVSVLRGGRRNRRNKNKKKDEGMTELEAVNWYVKNVLDQMSNDSKEGLLFAKAFQDKVAKEGLPQHLFNQIKNQNKPEGQMRDLNCMNEDCEIPLSLSGIWQYGCWCNFGDALTTGSGAPVSPHDKACQDMQQCLRCARNDGIDDGYDCDPKGQDYKAEFRFFPDDKALGADCSALNPGDYCATHICTCELQLIADILELIWAGEVYEKGFLHSEGFIPEDNCPQAGGPNGDQQCCGRYPRRYPYSAENKECCEHDEQIYYPMSQHCCESGVQELGDVC